jgi:hypothetical protein
MGNGSGPGRFNSRVYTNSWSYQAQRQFYATYKQDIGNAFDGLSIPQYNSTMYYTLSNNGPGAGARARRFGTQSNYNTVSFRVSPPFRGDPRFP